MSNTLTLEDRLEMVERELANLKKTVQAQSSRENWIDRFIGAFADDPEFDEVIRLGAEARAADRPADNGQ